jgi:hypothetical protein
MNQTIKSFASVAEPISQEQQNIAQQQDMILG